MVFEDERKLQLRCFVAKAKKSRLKKKVTIKRSSFSLGSALLCSVVHESRSISGDEVQGDDLNGASPGTESSDVPAQLPENILCCLSLASRVSCDCDMGARATVDVAGMTPPFCGRFLLSGPLPAPRAYAGHSAKLNGPSYMLCAGSERALSCERQARRPRRARRAAELPQASRTPPWPRAAHAAPEAPVRPLLRLLRGHPAVRDQELLGAIACVCPLFLGCRPCCIDSGGRPHLEGSKAASEEGAEVDPELGDAGAESGAGSQPTLPPPSQPSNLESHATSSASPASPAQGSVETTVPAVQVCIRMRPLLAWERAEGYKESAMEVRESPSGGMGICLQTEGRRNRQFQFNAVIGPERSQQEAWDMSKIDSVVSKVCKGFNATVFAYGQTGTGKTFTMEGFDYDTGQAAPSLNAASSARPRVKAA